MGGDVHSSPAVLENGKQSRENSSSEGRRPISQEDAQHIAEYMGIASSNNSSNIHNNYNNSQNKGPGAKPKKDNRFLNIDA